jgi:hypothetical protein
MYTSSLDYLFLLIFFNYLQFREYLLLFLLLAVFIDSAEWWFTLMSFARWVTTTWRTCVAEVTITWRNRVAEVMTTWRNWVAEVTRTWRNWVAEVTKTWRNWVVEVTTHMQVERKSTAALCTWQFRLQRLRNEGEVYCTYENIWGRK